MISEIRIPTLFGLGFLLIGLAIGVFFATQKTPLLWQSRAVSETAPKNVTLTNLSDASASVFWQTDQAVTCFLQAGTTASLGLTFRDERDLGSPQPHKLHFTTLTKLLPNTTYFWKIACGSTSYPSDKLSSFKTLSSKDPTNLASIIGTVVNLNLEPLSEALVVFETAGAQSLVTITKQAGSFLLPLSFLRTQDLTTNFTLPEGSPSATLTVFNQEKSSRIIFNLTKEEIILPPITLGQDLDLTPAPATASSQLKYDLNGDGVINSLDLSFIFKNFGVVRETKNSKQKQADLNGDGKVDQKDVDLLSPLTRQSP